MRRSASKGRLKVTFLVLLWSGVGQASPFHVRVDFAEGTPPDRTVQGVLVLEPTAKSTSEAPQRVPLTVPGEKQLDLPGAAWKARGEADGYWSESRPLAGGERERLLLAPVEVKVPDGKAYAPVEVRIPDTTLVCEVVDDAGRPVPGADVLIAAQRARPTRERQIQNSSHQTGPTGEVTIQGLPAGPVTLMAYKDERKSEWVRAELVDGSEGSPVRLTLRSLRSIEGRISSGGGGVPGAMVIAWPPFQGQGASHIAQDVAGPTGSFHLSVPQETSALNVLVFPPGHALRMLMVTTTPGSPLEIPVDPSSGTLVLDLDTGNGSMPLLVHNGVFVALQFLKPWMRMQGARQDDPRRLVLDGMEPGVYSLCGGAPAVGALTEGKAPPAASCSTGVLAAHSELVLQNP